MAEKTVYIIDLNDRASGKLKGLQTEAKKTDNQFSGLGKTIAGAFAGIAFASIGKDIVMTTARFQSLSNAIKFASDSSKQGELSLNWLQNLSTKYGFEIESTTEGFRTFQGAMINTKFSSNEVRKMFEQVSTGAAAMGLTAEDSKGVFLALGQIMGKGKVQAEELRGQIGERVPGAFNIAARAMGMTTMQLDKVMSTGNLMADDFLPKFAAEMEKTFGTGAMTNANSLNAEINRMSNSWTSLMLAMGNSTDGLINTSLRRLTEALTLITQQFESLDQTNKRLVGPDLVKGSEAYEKMAKAIVTTGQKQGLSPKQIEANLQQEGLKVVQENQRSLDRERATLEKLRADAGFRPGMKNLFGQEITKERADEAIMKGGSAEEKEKLTATKQMIAYYEEMGKIMGAGSPFEKQTSNLYRPAQSAIAGKTKKQGAGGINLSESRNGATNITINIDTFQENNFKDGPNDKSFTDNSGFLEKMRVALLQVTNDAFVLAGR